ncbi:MAG: DUF192 domain-containing protein [Chloroflexi bacterium]|nr:MAG: DUF192 domain-containing protein [Chloroflexota bacterium]
MARVIRVTNEERGTVLAERCRVATGLLQVVFGLHLLPRLARGEGLLLPGATTIDTTFMRYPIDLVFIDRQRRVTKLVPRLVPWRIVWGAGGGHDCLELPAGALDGTRTEVGDELRLEELSA